MNECRVCKTTKPFSEFYKRDTGKLRAECKACTRARAAAHKRRNPEKVAATNKAWKAKNRDKVLAIKKRWRDANKQLAEELVRDWGRRNRHKTREMCARRYAAKTQATPAWANKAAMRAIYADAVMRGMHVDHIVPLRGDVVCGLHCEANLQVLPMLENRLKSNRVWPDMP